MKYSRPVEAVTINNDYRANGLESVVTWYFSLPLSQRRAVGRMMREYRRLGIISVVALQEIYVLIMSAQSR
jgi:hypothetical protein